MTIRSVRRTRKPFQFIRRIRIRSGQGRSVTLAHDGREIERPKLTYALPEDPLFKTLVIRSFERIGGVRRLEKLYESALYQHELRKEQSIDNLFELVLAQLDVQLAYDEEQLAKIPSSGPVVFIANHPFGLLDGVAMCHLATVARGDFKILLHSSLCQEKRISPYALPIDFEETQEAIQTNIETKRRALELLRNNGTIIIFPGGGIATSEGWFGPVADLEWKLFVTKLIQMTKATVVPIYFHGQNSRFFQMVSQVSATVRLSLIVREIKKKIGSPIQIEVGDPIPYAQVSDIKKRRELLQFLRSTIYELGGKPEIAYKEGTYSESY